MIWKFRVCLVNFKSLTVILNIYSYIFLLSEIRSDIAYKIKTKIYIKLCHCLCLSVSTSRKVTGYDGKNEIRCEILVSPEYHSGTCIDYFTSSIEIIECTQPFVFTMRVRRHFFHMITLVERCLIVQEDYLKLRCNHQSFKGGC